MNKRGHDHLLGPRKALGDTADGTIAALPTRRLRARDERLELVGEVLEFRRRGGARTPGNMSVWRPQKKVLFTRMLVLGHGHGTGLAKVEQWLAA